MPDNPTPELLSPEQLKDIGIYCEGNSLLGAPLEEVEECYYRDVPALLGHIDARETQWADYCKVFWIQRMPIPVFA